MRFLVILSLLSFSCLANAAEYFKPIEGIENSQIKRVVASKVEKQVVYAASKNGLFKIIADQEPLKLAVFSDEAIRHLTIREAGEVIVVTSRSIYSFKDRLNKIFSLSDEEEFTSACISFGLIYAGTTKNCYQETISKSFKPCFNDELSVYNLAASGPYVFLAADKGVYRLEREKSPKRTFIIKGLDQDALLKPQVIYPDIFNPKKIWLGTSRGLFVSNNQGLNWRKIHISGLGNQAVYSFVQRLNEKGVLYAACAKGLFKIIPAKKSALWLYEGSASSKVYWLDIDQNNLLLAATGRGLLREAKGARLNQLSLQELLQDEPQIKEIQQAALRYNEVHPDKILKWRKGIRSRALFPKVSLSYDKTIYGSYAASSIHKTGYGGYKIGPRDWGIDLSWDMANLLWNTYQDDVDTRSRLNTQLRMDIIDEISRLYFERIRLKQETLTAEIPREELLQKKLRLRELTAILDGYTGGYYSKRINEIKSSY